MISKIFFAIFCIIAVAQAYRTKVTSSVSISPVLLDKKELMTSTCPTHSIVEHETGKTKDLLNKDHTFRPCRCGTSAWTKVALFNYSMHPCPDGLYRWNGTDPNTEQVIAGCRVFNQVSPCPGWLNRWDLRDPYTRELISGCAPQRIVMSSVPLPVNGVEYSAVCGRILGHGGLGGAFGESINTNRTIEDYYMTGVSLSHGPPGNRSHIWSFISARCEQDFKHPEYNCPCTNTDVEWPYQTPSFVGDHYFCDTDCREVHYTNDGEWRGDVKDLSDLLWDGKGCSKTNSCCSFNTPPYFCIELNYTTSQDMEMRVSIFTITTFLEIYIK